jgi:hypothetical protein
VNADPASAHPAAACGCTYAHADATDDRLEESVRWLLATSEKLAVNREEALAEVERLKAATDVAEAYIRAAASCLLDAKCTWPEKDEMGSQLNAALNALKSTTQEALVPNPLSEQGWEPGDSFRRWSRWWCILTAVIAVGAFAAGTMAG